MTPYPKQFLDLSPPFTDYNTAAIALLPVPYEGGVSYGRGAAGGPDWIIDASGYLELYDESLRAEPFRAGIATVAAPAVTGSPDQVQRSIFEASRQLLADDKFVVVVGGDHSISCGHFKALCSKYGRVSVIQLDAHADLRESYEDSPLSHACVMARLSEMTDSTLQLGLRSMSRQEARRIESRKLAAHTLEDLRSGRVDVAAELERLADPVYLTLDVDVFDWSVVRSTGTPEPGGLFWDEALALLLKIFSQKNIIGFDVVETAYDAGDRNSAFAVAKLIYRMLGYKLAAERHKSGADWPQRPSGPLRQPD